MQPSGPKDHEDLDSELLAVGEDIIRRFRRAHRAYDRAGFQDPAKHALEALGAYFDALCDAIETSRTARPEPGYEILSSVDKNLRVRTRGH